jgi:hypothetical protein
VTTSAVWPSPLGPLTCTTRTVMVSVPVVVQLTVVRLPVVDAVVGAAPEPKFQS